MRKYMTYELDEFRPWPELAIYVHGNAEISYRWEGRDRDAGLWPGPTDLELHYLEIRDHKTGMQHVIAKDHMLFKTIENALIDNPSAWEACRDDYES